ncbi:MAG: hypothetical protein FJ387_23255 [Verrucomicrobia bacterium]|nr:hypothetical protein [Verrucomicrobiota bacterium]
MLGNRAARGGGIAANRTGGAASHCTVVRNTASETGCGVYAAGGTSSRRPTFTSCIIRANVANDWAVDSAVDPRFVHCNLNPDPGGVNTVTDDPRLIFQWRLRADSPCIDAGTAADHDDLDGEPAWDHPSYEPAGGTTRDIGADEFVDADADRMADAWESEHFGSAANRDGTGDGDGDGLADADEYHWGTHPGATDTDGDRMRDGDEVLADTDPAHEDSFLGFVSVTATSSAVQLVWRGGTRVAQYLEARSALLGQEGGWVRLSTYLPPTPITNVYTGDLGSTPHRYYRIAIGE